MRRWRRRRRRRRRQLQEEEQEQQQQQQQQQHLHHQIIRLLFAKGHTPKKGQKIKQIFIVPETCCNLITLANRSHVTAIKLKLVSHRTQQAPKPPIVTAKQS
jgi:hypothetical protein